MIDRVTISPVAERHRTVLDAMAKRYFSEVLPQGPAYFPNALDRYWIEPGRHPYLIERNAAPVGFALVWNHPDGTHELTEFTIQTAHRHLGIGTQAAALIFQSLGGDWVLGVSRHPQGAMQFWQRCLEDCEGVCEIAPGPARTANQIGSFSFRVQR
mgnify:CR=1 FL=1|tara:strand:- start:447 stop:914 length:468 start_codon:yes stop_codon:yes gene_type:complete